MNLEEIRTHCLSKPGVTEDFPFDQTTLVFKVSGKIFLVVDSVNPRTVTLKCDPEKAMELRERYATITPGYHMSKKHWNTVSLKGNYSDRELKGWIDDSYHLVIQGLPFSARPDRKPKP